MATASIRRTPSTAAETLPTVPASRASWIGQLALEKLLLPVKAYAAVVAPSSGPLHQVHERCGQSIQYRKTCPQHGEVPPAEIAKAYTYAPDDEIVLSAEELAQLEPADKHIVRIEHIVRPQEIPCELLSGRTLYLIPANPVAVAAYAQVVQALAVDNRWGVGSGAISERRQPIGIHVVDGRLLLHVFHWPAHRRGAPSFAMPSAPGSTTEVRAMQQILSALAKSVDWEQYVDEYERGLMVLIQAKLARRARSARAPGHRKSDPQRIPAAPLKRARAA